VLAVAGGIWWYSVSQRAIREQDLAAALTIWDAPVGPASPYGKTFLTQDTKQQAALKAFSDVLAKHSGSREGFIAQYYLGTIKAQKSDTKGAESDLRLVADSGSEVSPLAKIALAQLYSGEKKTAEAQGLLRSLVNSPTDLVSKAQAQILLAQLDQSANPKESKAVLQSIDKSDRERPAVTRAADALSGQLAAK